MMHMYKYFNTVEFVQLILNICNFLYITVMLTQILEICYNYLNVNSIIYVAK